MLEYDDDDDDLLFEEEGLNDILLCIVSLKSKAKLYDILTCVACKFFFHFLYKHIILNDEAWILIVALILALIHSMNHELRVPLSVKKGEHSSVSSGIKVVWW